MLASLLPYFLTCLLLLVFCALLGSPGQNVMPLPFPGQVQALDAAPQRFLQAPAQQDPDDEEEEEDDDEDEEDEEDGGKPAGLDDHEDEEEEDGPNPDEASCSFRGSVS